MTLTSEEDELCEKKERVDKWGLRFEEPCVVLVRVWAGNQLSLSFEIERVGPATARGFSDLCWIKL